MENYLLSELTYHISHTRSSIFYNKKNNRKEASFLEYKLHTRASHLFLAADISLICFSSISSVSFATIFTAERLNQKIKRYPLGTKNENRSISSKLQRSQRQKKKKSWTAKHIVYSFLTGKWWVLCRALTFGGNGQQLRSHGLAVEQSFRALRWWEDEKARVGVGREGSPSASMTR